MTLAVALVLLGWGAQDPDEAPRIVPPSSYFRELVPQPTGQNGYEEVVKAAEILSGTAARLWVERIASPFPKADTGAPAVQGNPVSDLRRQIGALSYLEACREARKRYGSALALLRTGRTKPITYPHTVGRGTRFREIVSQIELMRLAVGLAHLEAAEGQSLRGTQGLVDVLDTSFQLGSVARISNMVFQANLSIFADWYRGNLTRLNLEELTLVERMLGDWNAKPSLEAATAQAEAAALRSMLTEISKDPSEAFNALTALVGANPRTWSANERNQILATAIADVEAEARRVQAMLALPEAQWKPTQREPYDARSAQNPVEFGHALFAALSPGLSQRTVVRMAAARTLRRLLLLHTKIEQYRWVRGGLPSSLESVAPGLVQDPLSGKRFVYQPLGGIYELFSEGGLGVEKIDLSFELPPERLGVTIQP